MKLDALDHPKTLDFAARLNIELPTAIGHLELFWAFVGKQAPQGNIGKWPDGAIARACYWNADPTVFVTALASAGFLDGDTKHRYLVHDWKDHAPRWVLSKLSRAKLCIFECSRECSGDSVREAQVREGKGSEAQECVAPLARANGATKPEGEMAIALRNLGVAVKSTDPVLHEWLKLGFTTQQAIDAVGIARIRKPHPEAIPANYLDKILRQPARPPPSVIDRVTWRPPPDEATS